MNPEVMSMRDIAAHDLERLLALNNAYAAEVNALTLEDFTQAVRIAAAARTVDGLPAFVIAFDERTPSRGPNHAWFLAREPAFLYVDRVVVAATAQRLGLGRRLYQDLLTIADGRPLCCEVNIEPPNQASLTFHERLGFTPCGEATDPRNQKRVRYLLLQRMPRPALA